MPAIAWTEEYIESLPKEDNTFERKASALFDLTDGKKTENFRNDLAKELSAFANSGGGSLILGVDNDGNIDGGLPLIAKGRQSTKEYLESIIPNLTDPEIIGFNVVELGRTGGRSTIRTDRAVYIVEVPDSDRAPHQSERDLKYYVRLGSKSQPAPHRIIEDIRNRTRHPRVVVSEMVISHVEHIAIPGSLRLRLNILIRNVSRIRAANSCLTISANTPLSLASISPDQGMRRGGIPNVASVELVHTIYPDMELLVTPIVVLGAQLTLPQRTSAPQGPYRTLPEWASLRIGETIWEESVVRTKLYADSAPPFLQEFTLAAIDSMDAIANLIRSVS